MRKSIFVAAIALAVAAGMLLPLRGERAAGQAGPYLINAINLDIAPVGYGGRMHRLELARSAQPHVVEVARGWSDARERIAVPSHAVNAFCSDRNQKSLNSPRPTSTGRTG